MPVHAATSPLAGVSTLVASVAQAASGAPAPATPLGRAIESILLALRYALLVVPVLIVAAELGRQHRARAQQRGGPCERCGRENDAPDAAFCRHCGSRLGRGAGTRA